MPQVSPMKWILLNALMQISIIQMTSILSLKSPFNIMMSNNQMIYSMKMSWKW